MSRRGRASLGDQLSALPRAVVPVAPERTTRVRSKCELMQSVRGATLENEDFIKIGGTCST